MKTNKLILYENKKIVIENYTNIFEILNNKIIIDNYEIIGKELKIISIDDYNILIKGEIINILYCCDNK